MIIYVGRYRLYVGDNLHIEVATRYKLCHVCCLWYQCLMWRYVCTSPDRCIIRCMKIYPSCCFICLQQTEWDDPGGWWYGCGREEVISWHTSINTWSYRQERIWLEVKWKTWNCLWKWSVDIFLSSTFNIKNDIFQNGHINIDSTF